MLIYYRKSVRIRSRVRQSMDIFLLLATVRSEASMIISTRVSSYLLRDRYPYTFLNLYNFDYFNGFNVTFVNGSNLVLLTV